MKIKFALTDVSRLYLDTAPVIYYVQGVTPFFPVVDRLFQEIETGAVSAISSPITLAECLVLPLKFDDPDLQQSFTDFLTDTEWIYIVNIDPKIGKQAANLRVRYGLKLPDALQIATAIAANCQAFLTNDIKLQRVNELRVLLISDLEV